MLVPKFGGMVSRIFAKSDAIGSLPHVVKKRSPESAGAVLPCNLSPWHRRQDELKDACPRSACAALKTPCQMRGSAFCARTATAHINSNATTTTDRIGLSIRPGAIRTVDGRCKELSHVGAIAPIPHIECADGRTVRNTAMPGATRPSYRDASGSGTRLAAMLPPIPNCTPRHGFR